MVSNLQFSNIRTHCSDDAGRLMTKSEWLSHDDVAIPEVVEVVKVRTTQAC